MVELQTDAGPAWIGAPAIWGGELDDIGFDADCSPTGEVPPVTDSQASGLGSFTFDVQTRQLDYMIQTLQLAAASHPNGLACWSIK